MPGKEGSRIFHTCTTLESRFKYVADLSRNAAESGHRQHMRRLYLHPISEHGGHQQHSEHIPRCSFPCLDPTELGRHLQAVKTESRKVPARVPRADHPATAKESPP